ncbi:kinase-like protein [Trichoderma reesei RUT C-30]|uniref:Kinase-like protein n=1 Tax=Hypocrea jecorina (strain ATCC 56765 / BCRC 32924 / NRRL 11460 / Rut C-30) TaxID=1344414 RepID=A0A024SFA8_HYPJR|nr:kinase-like protein [Trichoderma reesei RUT C-30]
MNEPWKVIAGKQLRSKLIPESGDAGHKQFLPLGDLDSILSRESIASILGELPDCGSEMAEAMCSEIRGEGCEPSLKILATLIMIERVEHIIVFLELGIRDDKLPLPLDHQAEIFWNWSAHEIETFCEKQYVVIAPVFDFRAIKHVEWKKNFRMPFLEKLEWKRSGAHGEIAQIRIHPDHQVLENDLNLGSKTRRLALKRFKVQVQYHEFKQERDALIRFRSAENEHKNLIKLLLSYSRGGKHYLVFPWAQGNLVEFWKNTFNNPKSGRHSMWLIQQCFDISDALTKVHGSTERLSEEARAGMLGRHGDIKPENILYFGEPDSGECYLVVADFTLMRFHSTDTVHYTDATRVDFSRTYRPPEVMQASKVRIDQSYDVWTLGCVYLEFVTWYLIGYHAIREENFGSPTGDLLDNFQALRKREEGNYEVSDDKFFYYYAGYPKWIRMLHRNEHCSNAMHDFLSLIENHMLVPLPSKRYAMSQVRDALGRIATKCQRDDDYCYKGNPERSFGAKLSDLFSLARYSRL